MSQFEVYIDSCCHLVSIVSEYELRDFFLSRVEAFAVEYSCSLISTRTWTYHGISLLSPSVPLDA